MRGHELDEMRRDGESAERRRAFARAERARTPAARGLEAAVRWSESLRELLGDRPASRRIVRQATYRL